MMINKIEAHRIILSSQSLFFMRILKVNVKQNILIYLPNVSSGELETILEFLYLGQTEIDESDLGKFINFGQIFEIKGLVDLQFNPTGEEDVAKNIKGAGYEDDGLLISKSLLKRQLNGKFSCDQCDYQSVVRGAIIRHKEAIHLGIKYSCDECPKEMVILII